MDNQDNEYIFDLVYNSKEKKMLQKLANAYNTKFYNNDKIRKIIIDYSVSSYTEPDCFPCQTPIKEIPELLDYDSRFINKLLSELDKTQNLGCIFPELFNSILNQINDIPEEINLMHYNRIKLLFQNKFLLKYYCNEMNFNNFHLLLKPRLCPDIYNFHKIPKEKEILYGLSNEFKNVHQKIADILLLFCKCKETRENTIKWLYLFVDKNKSRKKTRPDNDCNTDGFVLNFLGVMFILCEPFMSIYSDKIQKINLEDTNSNFISQCYDITSKMIDYGLLTTLNNYRNISYRYRDNDEKSYLIDAYHSQMCNLVLLNNLKDFVSLQLHIINNNKIKDENILETIWNTVEYLIPFKLIDYNFSDNVIKYYCNIEDINNPHLKCEVGRITASVLSLKQSLIPTNLMGKFIKLYGNLANVDTQNQFLCRREISKCIEEFGIDNVDDKTLSDFCYAVISEFDSLSSKSFDSLSELRKKIEEKEEINEEYKSNIVLNMNVTNDILSLLKKTSQSCKKSFKDDCCIKKFSSCWSFVIYRLIGPKSLELKIVNSEFYHFNPKEMLISILEVFNNLCCDEIIDEIGKIGLLDKNIFNKMIRILNREKFLSQNIINNIKKKIDRISIPLDDEDIPEEFLDALLDTIMDDPVILPSKNVVDKTTILQHLKNDTSDPFTREELKEEDLVYDNDLKQKIQLWKNNRKNI